MLKNSPILSLKIFFFALALLRVAKQSINSFISLGLAIIDIEMVVGQLLASAYLAKSQVFCIYEPM